jgi:hypothetical protein
VGNLSKHMTKIICIIYLSSNQETETCSNAISLLEIQIYPCFVRKLDKPFNTWIAQSIARKLHCPAKAQQNLSIF